MQTVGQAIDGVMARLEEARESQAEELARDIYTLWSENPDPVWPPIVMAGLWRAIARGLQAKGYRKAAQ